MILKLAYFSDSFNDYKYAGLLFFFVLFIVSATVTLAGSTCNSVIPVAPILESFISCFSYSSLSYLYLEDDKRVFPFVLSITLSSAGVYLDASNTESAFKFYASTVDIFNIFKL